VVDKTLDHQFQPVDGFFNRQLMACQREDHNINLDSFCIIKGKFLVLQRIDFMSLLVASLRAEIIVSKVRGPPLSVAKDEI